MNTEAFKPLSAERAAQIRELLRQARDPSRGVAVDRETGEIRDVIPLKQADPERVNMIGKFDTHYVGRC